MVVKFGSYRRQGVFGRAASAIPVPLQVPDLELWLDADLSPITLNGSNVAQINDLSGNGRHFTASGGAQPLYEATGWGNGTAQMDFDGSTDYLTANLGAGFGSTITPGFTVFMLLNPDAVAAGTFIQLFGTSTGGNHALFWNDASDEMALFIGGFLQFSGATRTATEQLQTVNYTDGRSANQDAWLYIDGVQTGNSGNVSVDHGFSGTTDFFRQVGTNARYFPGKVKSILVYSRAFDLAGTEQTKIENYLMTRAGL